MKKSILFLTLLFLSINTSVKAQMFSVDEDNRDTNPFSPYLRVGVKIIDFSYQGDLSNSGDLSLQTQAANITFESGIVTISASLANKLTGLKNRNYLDLKISLEHPFYLTYRKNYRIGIPLKISSKLTNVQSEFSNDKFSQTILSAGIGGVVELHFPEILGASLQLLPNYGFSSASGGFIGGSVFSLTGMARLNLYDFLFSRNWSIGYNYEFNNYDIDEDTYDYDFTGHTLTIGVSL